MERYYFDNVSDSLFIPSYPKEGVVVKNNFSLNCVIKIYPLYPTRKLGKRDRGAVARTTDSKISVMSQSCQANDAFNKQ